MSAQGSFLTSYYAGLNSYTSTLATASVGHSTAKAQATADYYINKADREADQSEADLADAIANNADSSTINSLTATATSSVATSNATALATITADIATATGEIKVHPTIFWAGVSLNMRTC